jgi:DMSO/TMAO reductase YedYZ molybdopterin-dependent catalytic subunit
MVNQQMSRRSLLKGGGAALAGLSALQVTGPAHAFPGQPDEVVLPWLDQPEPHPPQYVQLTWEQLDSWLTPNDEFFVVYHYDVPALVEQSWRLGITGLVGRPQSLGITDLKARPRREQTVTLECSGDHGFPFFTGAVGNARWAGTPLAPLLQRAGLHEKASEVVFYGADAGKLTIRDNPGVLRPGETGTVTKDENGQFDLTIVEQFSRSMSVEEALNPDNLLCYEMNGAALPAVHGFPVRLIAPGWYGVANVKWLTRIEVVDQRHAGRFMARDYVSIREQKRGAETVWTFSNVNHMRLKSAPAKVTRRRGRYTIMGAAWGAPIADVEVSIDEGPWIAADLDRPRASRGWHGREAFAWSFWTLPWNRATPGEHRIASRAFDFAGNVQPAPQDPYLASRVTYWENNGQITRRVLIP